MHHDLSWETAFLIGALGVVGVIILVALLRPLANKLFFFDWPPLYDWQQARRPLRRVDQWRVIRATGRNHLVGRAALADAQLAYARYCQARAQRALDRQRRRRGWRVGALLLQGIAVAGFTALAAAHSQQRVVYGLGAAGQALGILGGLLESSRSLSRRVERMTRLQAQIEDRVYVG